MRIGYLVQAGVPDVRQRPLSGPAIHVKHVFAKLQQLGHQVRLVAQLNGRIWISDDLETFTPAPAGPLDSGLPRLAERAIRRVQGALHLPYAVLFESLRFAHACRHALAGYDAFYERMGWVGYGGVLAARQMAVPLVWEVNGDHLDELESLGMAPRGAQRILSTALVRWSVGQTAHIVAAGDGWRTKFMRRWRTPPAKITTVENGTQIADFLSRADLRSFTPETNAPAPVTIAYVGGFYPWQGVGVLVQAFAQACQNAVNARLLLIGSGPQEADLRAQIDNLGIAGRVIFTGHVSLAEVAGHLAQADIGVSPYCGRDEFSGLKLLDYKAAGLAIVASGQNGQPAILENGRTAVIVPPCDVDALSDALQDLCTDSHYRRCLGRNARAEAEAQHRWRHTAKQIEKILEQVVKEATT